jgi:hypothetical protein
MPWTGLWGDWKMGPEEDCDPSSLTIAATIGDRPPRRRPFAGSAIPAKLSRIQIGESRGEEEQKIAQRCSRIYAWCGFQLRTCLSVARNLLRPKTFLGMPGIHLIHRFLVYSDPKSFVRMSGI